MPYFWSTYNTSLGKFGSKIIQGRLLIEDLRYVPSSLLSFLGGFCSSNYLVRGSKETKTAAAIHNYVCNEKLLFKENIPMKW